MPGGGLGAKKAMNSRVSPHLPPTKMFDAAKGATQTRHFAQRKDMPFQSEYYRQGATTNS